jgi:beta-carotene 3-hydroxylase
VGPLAGVPALQRIAAAHQVHHSGKLGGLPWGLFLGPQELAAVPGGEQELARQLAQLRL